MVSYAFPFDIEITTRGRLNQRAERRSFSLHAELQNVSLQSWASVDSSVATGSRGDRSIFLIQVTIPWASSVFCRTTSGSTSWWTLYSSQSLIISGHNSQVNFQSQWNGWAHVISLYAACRNKPQILSVIFIPQRDDSGQCGTFNAHVKISEVCAELLSQSEGLQCVVVQLVPQSLHHGLLQSHHKK